MYLNELIFPGVMKKGNRGAGVKRLQEWLCLDGCNTAIDGDFGPATEAAVKAFQFRHTPTLSVSGIVDNITWMLLTSPMADAMRSIVPIRTGNAAVILNDSICKYAAQHLLNKAREVGGDNCGPWARLYLRGKEKLPWCAAFVSTILAQAAGDKKPPLTYTMGCDALAVEAKKLGLFVPGVTVIAKGINIPAGSIFLLRKSENDWFHTGFVTEHKAKGAAFQTIEGNTNNDGSANGNKVAARFRALKASVDFVLFK